MIGRLTGEVAEVHGRTVLLDVSGVGYEVECSAMCVQSFAVGQRVSCIIYTEVREDVLRLYGFLDRLEKQVFLLLLKVKGVGVKTAADIVSQVDKQSLLRMIGVQDSRGLTSIKGLGKKTAERIILELKDKVSEFVMLERVVSEVGGSDQGVQGEALAALCALGFSVEQSRTALRRLNEGVSVPHFSDAGELVSAALKYV
jgi:holliday junction DNA helicase RuvA